MVAFWLFGMVFPKEAIWTWRWEENDQRPINGEICALNNKYYLTFIHG